MHHVLVSKGDATLDTGLSCTSCEITQMLCNDTVCLEMYVNYIYQYKLQGKKPQTQNYFYCAVQEIPFPVMCGFMCSLLLRIVVTI